VTRFDSKTLNTYRHSVASLMGMVAFGCASGSPVQNITASQGEAATAQLRLDAEGGDAQAESRLAFAYQMGEGVRVDHAAAFEWHRKAAKQGEIASQAALGRAFLEGIGCEKQPIRGLHWLRKAAHAGEPNAQALLGATYIHGVGRSLVRSNHVKAEKWLLAASEQGLAQAQYDLATFYFNLQENNEEHLEAKGRALAWLRKAVDQNHPRAHTLLSSLYRTGRGVPRNDVESIRLLRRAAELGDPEGQNEYGLALREGSRVKRNARESFEWFERAAWIGYTDAQFNLGLAYLKGRGVEQDRIRALAWLEICRDQTHRDAIRELGRARRHLTAEERKAAQKLHQEIAARLADIHGTSP